MTGIGSGIASQLCAVAETTYGVAPSLAAAKFYEFKNEGLKLKKNTVQGQGLHGGGLYDRASRRVITYYSAAGPVTMDLPTQGLNQLLYAMFGSYGQANAVLTEDGTTGAYKATHAPGSLLGNSMCWQKGVPAIDGTVQPFTYVGTKIQSWKVSIETGALAQLDLNLVCRNELAGAGNGDPLNGTIPTLEAFSEPATNSVFHFREAILYTGGTASTTSGITTVSGSTAAGNVKSAELGQEVSLATGTERLFLGSNGFASEPIENNFRKISGQFVIEWLSSQAMYNAYSADTPTTLELSFVGPTIGSGSDQASLILLIPQIRLDGDSPNVDGPKIVQQTVPFTGLDDSLNNQIQASYVTLDAS